MKATASACEGIASGTVMVAGLVYPGRLHKLLLAVTALATFTIVLNVYIQGEGQRVQHPSLLRVLSTSRSKAQVASRAIDVIDTKARSVRDVRVLFWVMTAPQNHQSKAKTVRDTWGRRAGRLLFFSTQRDDDIPTIGLSGREGRQMLTHKSLLAWRYVFDHHLHDADWFMKTDDDTYVIVENLRYFLSEKNSNDAVYFGHHFKTFIKGGYSSGGSGYVISKEALRRLGSIEQEQLNATCGHYEFADDVAIGHCLMHVGARIANSTDHKGRSRFHCLNPEAHLAGIYPDWYYKYDANGARKGADSISDYAVSFHYITPSQMRVLDFFAYRLTVYGRQDMGHEDLSVQ